MAFSKQKVNILVRYLRTIDLLMEVKRGMGSEYRLDGHV